MAVAAAQGYDSLYLLKAAIYSPPFTPTNHEAVTDLVVKVGVVLNGTVVPAAAYKK